MSDTEGKFVSRSVLFQGSDAALGRFCESLGIAEQRRFLDCAPKTYEFMAERKNHLDGGALDGDFRYGFDLFLWDRTESEFLAVLEQLSSDQMSIATDDPDGGTPFSYMLFHRGQRIAVEIMDDEIVGETYLHKPEAVRAELKALV